jgi:hypothetical protein
MEVAMANKKSIDQINAELDSLHKRLSKTVRKIDELRDLRKRIRRGLVKQPAPAGIKYKIKGQQWDSAAPDFNDPIPGFGSGASGMGVG